MALPLPSHSPCTYASGHRKERPPYCCHYPTHNPSALVRAAGSGCTGRQTKPGTATMARFSNCALIPGLAGNTQGGPDREGEPACMLLLPLSPTESSSHSSSWIWQSRSSSGTVAVSRSTHPVCRDIGGEGKEMGGEGRESTTEPTAEGTGCQKQIGGEGTFTCLGT